MNSVLRLTGHAADRVMKKLLLLLPLLAFVSACSPPPEITAAKRDEAFDACLKEVEEDYEKVMQEREIARTKPHLYDTDREDFYDNFDYPYLVSDKYERVTILKTYCKPIKLDWPGMWSNVGYIEYLVEPYEYGESEVKRVMVSYGRVWKESR